MAWSLLKIRFLWPFVVTLLIGKFELGFSQELPSDLNRLSDLYLINDSSEALGKIQKLLPSEESAAMILIKRIKEIPPEHEIIAWRRLALLITFGSFYAVPIKYTDFAAAIVKMNEANPQTKEAILFRNLLIYRLSERPPNSVLHSNLLDLMETSAYKTGELDDNLTAALSIYFSRFDTSAVPLEARKKFASSIFKINANGRALDLSIVDFVKDIKIDEESANAIARGLLRKDNPLDNRYFELIKQTSAWNDKVEDYFWSQVERGSIPLNTYKELRSKTQFRLEAFMMGLAQQSAYSLQYWTTLIDSKDIEILPVLTKVIEISPAHPKDKIKFLAAMASQKKIEIEDAKRLTRKLIDRISIFYRDDELFRNLSLAWVDEDTPFNLIEEKLEGSNISMQLITFESLMLPATNGTSVLAARYLSALLKRAKTKEDFGRIFRTDSLSLIATDEGRKIFNEALSTLKDSNSREALKEAFKTYSSEKLLLAIDANSFDMREFLPFIAANPFTFARDWLKANFEKLSLNDTQKIELYLSALKEDRRLEEMISPFEDDQDQTAFIDQLVNFISKLNFNEALALLSKIRSESSQYNFNLDAIINALKPLSTKNDPLGLMLAFAVKSHIEVKDVSDEINRLKQLTNEQQLEFAQVVLITNPFASDHPINLYLSQLIQSNPEEPLKLKLLEKIEAQAWMPSIEEALISIAQKRPMGKLQELAYSILINKAAPQRRVNKVIIDYINDPEADPDMRLLAIFRFPMAASNSIAPALKSALADQDIPTSAIGSAIEYSPRAIEEIIRLSRDPDEQVRSRAIVVLSDDAFSEEKNRAYFMALANGDREAQAEAFEALINLIPYRLLPKRILLSKMQEREYLEPSLVDEIFRRIQAGSRETKLKYCEVIFQKWAMDGERIHDKTLELCPKDAILKWLEKMAENYLNEVSSENPQMQELIRMQMMKIVYSYQRLGVAPPVALMERLKPKITRHNNLETEVALRSDSNILLQILNHYLDTAEERRAERQSEDGEDYIPSISSQDEAQTAQLPTVNLMDFSKLLKDHQDIILTVILNRWPSLSQLQKDEAASLLSHGPLKWSQLKPLHTELLAWQKMNPRALPLHAFLLLYASEEIPDAYKSELAKLVFEAYRDRYFQSPSSDEWLVSDDSSLSIAVDLQPVFLSEVLRRLDVHEPLSQMAALKLLTLTSKDKKLIEAYAKKLLRHSDLAVQADALVVLRGAKTIDSSDARLILQIIESHDKFDFFKGDRKFAAMAAPHLLELVRERIKSATTSEQKENWGGLYSDLSNAINLPVDFEIENYRNTPEANIGLLKRFSSSSEHYEPLVQKVLEDFESNDDARMKKALETLPHLRNARKFFVGRIYDLIENHSSLALKIEAIFALAKYQEPFSPYLSIIQEALNSNDNNLRLKAAQLVIGSKEDDISFEVFLSALKIALPTLSFEQAKFLSARRSLDSKQELEVKQLLNERIKTGSAMEKSAAAVILNSISNPDEDSTQDQSTPVSVGEIEKPELTSLLCHLAQTSTDSLNASKGEMNYPSASWKLAVQSLNVLFLLKASPYCPEAKEAVQKWLDTNYNEAELQCAESSHDDLAKALKLSDLSIRLHSQMRSAPQLYGDTFVAGLLTELLETPNEFKFDRARALDARNQISSQLDAALQLIGDEAMEADYVGNSNFNSYALSAAFAHLPTPTEKAIEAMQTILPDIETREGDSLLNISYSPNTKIKDSPRAASARAPVYHLGLYLHSPEHHEKYREGLIASLENFRKHMPDLMRNVVREGTHMGKDGLAPYYFFSSLPYVMSAFEVLKQDNEVSKEQRKQLQDLQADIWKTTYEGLFDSKAGRFQSSPTDFYSWTDFSWNALAGLAIVPLLDEDDDQTGKDRLGIIQRAKKP